MGVMGLIPFHRFAITLKRSHGFATLKMLARLFRCASSSLVVARRSLRVPAPSVPVRVATRSFFLPLGLNVLSAVLIIELAFFFATDFSHFQLRVIWLSPACRSTFSTHVAPLLFSSALLRRIDRDIIAVWIHDSWFSFWCNRRLKPMISLILFETQNESAFQKVESRIAELTAAKDFGAELSWNTNRLDVLILRRSDLQAEREKEVQACMAVEAKKIADQAEYRMEFSDSLCL